MANNLKDHLKEVADAIRAKKGTTDLINPQDFSKEIASIEGGGSGGGTSESTWRYFDVTSVPNDKKFGLAEFQPFLAKSTIGITAYALPIALEIAETITAMGIDGEVRIIIGDFDGKISSFLDVDYTKQIFEELGITEITKEQFYSLE